MIKKIYSVVFIAIILCVTNLSQSLYAGLLDDAVNIASKNDKEQKDLIKFCDFLSEHRELLIEELDESASDYQKRYKKQKKLRQKFWEKLENHLIEYTSMNFHNCNDPNLVSSYGGFDFCLFSQANKEILYYSLDKEASDSDFLKQDELREQFFSFVLNVESFQACYLIPTPLPGSSPPPATE